MFSIKRALIGIVAAFAIGAFALSLPITGGSASADGGAGKSVIESLGVKYTMNSDAKINPELLNPEIRCEDPGCLGLSEGEGIYFIRCEDQDCLRTVSTVAVPDGGTVVLGGIRCEDQDCL